MRRKRALSQEWMRNTKAKILADVQDESIILTIPNDPLAHIISFLDPPSVWTMYFTCKRIHENCKYKVLKTDEPMLVAARRGYINVLAWFHELNPKCWKEELSVSAIKANQFETVKWLHNNDCPFPSLKVLELAARTGNVEMVRWLAKTTGLRVTGLCHYFAAKYGHWDIITKLPSVDGKLSFHVVLGAARAGNLRKLKDLVYDNPHLWRFVNSTPSFSSAVGRGGSVEILEWIQLHGFSLVPQLAMAGATYAGHIEMMDWLTQKFPELLAMEGLFYRAISEGRTNSVKFLLEKNFTRPSNLVYFAATKGKLEVLKYLVDEERFTADMEKLFMSATQGGHMNILGWLASGGAISH